MCLVPPPTPFPQVDIYSLGCIMYYIFCGEAPFSWLQPVEACRQAAMELKRPSIRPNLDPRLAQLLSACWDPLPERRPEAKNIIETLEQIFPNCNSHLPIGEEGCQCSLV